jgi:hypothetical protein
VAEIWRTQDRAGREVVLTPTRLDHILGRHNYMAGRLDQVRTAVEQPDFVTRDSEYPRREICYRRTPSGQGLMKVVVNYRPAPPQGTWIGEVITAYRIDERNIQEVQLWP